MQLGYLAVVQRKAYLLVIVVKQEIRYDMLAAVTDRLTQ